MPNSKEGSEIVNIINTISVVAGCAFFLGCLGAICFSCIQSCLYGPQPEESGGSVEIPSRPEPSTNISESGIDDSSINADHQSEQRGNTI